jgi:hypothetical protein
MRGGYFSGTLWGNDPKYLKDLAMTRLLLALAMLTVAGCAGSPAWNATASDAEKRAYWSNRCTTLYGIPPAHPDHGLCIMAEVRGAEARLHSAGRALATYGAFQAARPVYRPPAQVHQF